MREKADRDRLIEFAECYPEYVSGFQDEVWWSRVAQPHLHPALRLVAQTAPKTVPGGIMSLPQHKSHRRNLLPYVPLLVFVAIPFLYLNANAAAVPVTPGDGPRSLTSPQALPVVQVTTDQGSDYSPTLVQTADGKLLTVFLRNGALWSRASTDSGAMWGSETQINECCQNNLSLAIDSDATLWLAYERNGDIWYRTSVDQGATWSADTQLTTDANDDYNPAILQASDGKLWIIWYSYRTGNADIWYKASADGGATWSAETALTSSGDVDDSPTVAQAADGKLWVVWQRNGQFWYRTSADGGTTWSAEAQVDGRCCYHEPSLAVASDGVLWLFGESNTDVWYQTSANNGTTWTAPAQFTRFMGDDSAPDATALAAGKVGLAWQSSRSGNWDIWFGIPGEREDINPPPWVNSIAHQPGPNPDNATVITFTVRVQDETGVVSVALVWTLNGTAQADLPMYDDGAHGDGTAGDAVFGAQHTALPVGSQVTYRIRATDADGNTYLSGQNAFHVLPPFTKTADLLFVPDYGGNDTSGFRGYFTQALDALDYTYDVWDTGMRGSLTGAILDQYTGGIVIWGVIAWWGYLNNGDQQTALKSYLDAGGKLFITGQNIAEALNWSGGTGFLNDYLHANFAQSDTGLFALAGAASDPIGAGLALNLSGGDGANNQWSKDEIDPNAPAEAVFTYQTSASAMLAEPSRPREETPSGPQEANHLPAPDMSGVQPRPDVQAKPTANTAAAPAGTISSGTAGLRVDTGTYKVVYFAFGFEGINSASNRAAVMDRTLAWLRGIPPRPKLLAPADGQAVHAGEVAFSWTSAFGATSYEIQIDTVPTFDSAGIILQTSTAPSYSHPFTTSGTRYWRVRALPGGNWTAAWILAVPPIEWSTEPIDAPRRILENSIQIDSTGKVYIAYGSDNLYYAVYDGSSWSTSVIDAGHSVSDRPSLAIDRDGMAHVIYRSMIGDLLKYARQTSSGWSITTISQSKVTFKYSLALDSAGQPRIAYRDDTANQLKYARWNGSGWDTETVDPVAAESYNGASLVLDSNNYPHITYDLPNGLLKYAYWNGIQWVLETIGAGEGMRTPIAINSSNSPSVASSLGDVLQFSRRTAEGWSTEQVDSSCSSSPGVYPISLAIDSRGDPHLTYTCYPMLKYAYWNGSQWATQDVAMAANSSLALDSDNVPNIAYNDPISLNLKHAKWNGEGWVTQTVDHGGFVGWYPSLALDMAGNPHVSYADQYSLSLKYGHKVGSSWITETVESTGGWRLFTSLAVDRFGNPHISYQSSSGLRYAYWDGSRWNFQTVDGPAQYTSLVLDSGGFPHIAYCRGGLRYARWDGSAWVIQQVDSYCGGGDVGGETTLALDRAGKPRIVYGGGSVIRYASWDGDAWTKEIISSSAYAPSLALDNNDHPHIGFSHGAVIKHAYKNGDSWSIEVVNDAIGHQGLWGTSIAVDPLDRPHMAFEADTELYALAQYAHWDGSTWTSADADQAALIGPVLLALAEHNQPRIAYFDWMDGDVRYIYGTSIDAVPPTTSPEVAISRDGGGLRLQWADAVPNLSYQVWRGREPYFALQRWDASLVSSGRPPEGCSLLDGIISCSDSADNMHTPETNYFYVVRAYNDAAVSADSSRVGEFTFALSPGQP